MPSDCLFDFFIFYLDLVEIDYERNKDCSFTLQIKRKTPRSS